MPRPSMSSCICFSPLFSQMMTGRLRPASAAVTSSGMVNMKPPSPASTATGVSGRAIFAPIALGRALPSAQYPAG